jgi:hypothetical protein
MPFFHWHQSPGVEVIEPVGGPTIDTGIFKFGGGSLKIDSGESVIYTMTDRSWGDFTIECWFYPVYNTNYTSNWIVRVGELGLKHYAINSTSGQFSMDADTLGSGERVMDATNNGPDSFAYDTWHHIAMSRQGSQWRLWVNGTGDGQNYLPAISNSSDFDSTEITIGALADGTDGINGYIDEVRVSTTARYTNDSFITVPTAAFVRDSTTWFLAHYDTSFRED